MTQKKLQDIKTQFETRGVKRVKIGAVDIDGVLRGKYVSLDKFWSIAEGGLGFCDVIFGWDIADQLYDRPTMTGWHTGYPDTHAKIDLDTMRIIPWEPDTAAFLLDLYAPDGQPLEVSPRQLLRKMIARAEGLGFHPYISAEFEFFIYQETPWTVADQASASSKPLSPGMFGYSWLRTSQSSQLVHDLLDWTKEYDVPIEGFHTETGPGVFEAALQYTNALTAADRAVLFKTSTKEICHRHGLTASFMAKPSVDLPGCSGHLHQSLTKAASGKSAFYDDSAEHGMSKTMRHYVAGILELLPDFTAIYAPNINSYKRLVPGTWAPTSPTWGVENRTCALRAIPGSEKSTRLEVRVTGSDINPYLAMGASLAAGLYGIENQLELPPAVEGNAYDLTGGVQLPSTLRGATETIDKSARARQVLGDAFVDHYVVTRDWECRQAERAVTDWEHARYFELA